MRQRFQNFGPIQLELNRSHLWGRFDSTYVGGRHMHVAKRVPEVTRVEGSGEVLHKLNGKTGIEMSTLIQLK